MEETPIERPHLVRRDPTVATPPTLLRLLAPPVPLLEACRQRPLPPSSEHPPLLLWRSVARRDRSMARCRVCLWCMSILCFCLHQWLIFGVTACIWFTYRRFDYSRIWQPMIWILVGILSSDGGEAASVWYGRCRVRLESGLLLLHFPLLHSSRYSPPITNTKPSTLHLHFTHT